MKFLIFFILKAIKINGQDNDSFYFLNIYPYNWATDMQYDHLYVVKSK